jgi:hypothetical protein
MAESRLEGRFWLCATQNGVICCNATFKQKIGTMPFEKVYGIKKDVSKFKPFGCLAYMHLIEQGKEREREACSQSG